MDSALYYFKKMDESLDSEIEKPENWPQNGREQQLDLINQMINEFVDKPTHATRERMLAVICNSDANEFAGYGEMRVTEYEAHLINSLYLKAEFIQANSIKAYLYDLIAETTRLQKIKSWTDLVIDNGSQDGYRIMPYESILRPQMAVYHYAYQKYTIEKTNNFSTQLIKLMQYNLKNSDTNSINILAYAYISLLTDISYMRGNKKEKLWEFSRQELTALFEFEAKVLKAWGKSIVNRPIKGMIKVQIANFILKSRNGYNDDYICKYIPKDVAKMSFENKEIWMNDIKNLNDKREQRVVPELFTNTDWLPYEWGKNIDFTPVRKYYVSSYSKNLFKDGMKDDYGDCLYGYKNDRIIDLIGPIGIREYTKNELVNPDMPSKMEIPFLTQVVALDVIYDREAAKEEIRYLQEVVNMFDLSDNDKHSFFEEILQYWLLSVKDYDWHDERERRYVIFLYPSDYEYLETVIEDGFLKIKTSLFMTPDFVIGENPSWSKIKFQLDNKQRALMSREYFHCKRCLVQDYDFGIHKMPDKCPICGSLDIEMIYPK